MKEIRRSVANELKVPEESFELSMGMSSDYKEAVFSINFDLLVWLDRAWSNDDQSRHSHFRRKIQALTGIVWLIYSNLLPNLFKTTLFLVCS